MNAQNIYLIIFFCIAYLILTDQSIAKAFYMLTQLARVQYEKVKWWVAHNPANPIIRYFMWRRSMKIAKELMEELAEKQKKV
jgi:Fe-S oxidoreductase